MSAIVLEKCLNGISPRTACKCLDVVYEDASRQEQIEVYHELKRYFESILLCEIKRHYEEHYI